MEGSDPEFSGVAGLVFPNVPVHWVPLMCFLHRQRAGAQKGQVQPQVTQPGKRRLRAKPGPKAHLRFSLAIWKTGS